MRVCRMQNAVCKCDIAIWVLRCLGARAVLYGNAEAQYPNIGQGVCCIACCQVGQSDEENEAGRNAGRRETDEQIETAGRYKTPDTRHKQ